MSIRVEGEGITVDVESLAQRIRDRGEGPSDVLIQYMTQADNRVRPTHAVLHGTLWEPDDPNRPIPPLDYGCRCYLRPVSTDPDVARARGVELVSDPPETPAEAIEEFKRDVEAATGVDVSNADLFGKTVGKLIDDGEITVDDALSDDGNEIGALEATMLAAGVRRSLIFSTLQSLRAMGIKRQDIRRVLAEARRQDGSKIERIRKALLVLQPGAIAGRTERTTEARVDRAARLIHRIAGGLL